MCHARRQRAWSQATLGEHAGGRGARRLTEQGMLNGGMEHSYERPAAEVRIGDLITVWDGTGYRVREITPSASGKTIEIEAIVEVVASGGPELGRRSRLGKRAGTILTVVRAG